MKTNSNKSKALEAAPIRPLAYLNRKMKQTRENQAVVTTQAVTKLYRDAEVTVCIPEVLIFSYVFSSSYFEPTRRWC